MEDKHEILMKELKYASYLVYLYSKQAHDAIFKDDRNEAAVVGYLNAASSQYAIAKSIYVNNIEDFWRPDIDKFFECFTTYMNEVLRNVDTKHSHQWSDIEYNNLDEAFHRSALSLPG